MKTYGFLLAALFTISIAAHSDERQSGAQGANATVADNSTTSSQGDHLPSKAPLKPYPRLLPLQLIAPPSTQVGVPMVGVSVSIQNPGDRAPNARLRLSIRETDHSHVGDHRELTPDNIKVEILENGEWTPVLLSVVAGNVMGVIGPEGATAHPDRYKRGGFEIPAGLNKTWQLRVTFSSPGTYSLVASVSPDNGSRHLAQPAHSIIEVH